MPNDGKLKKTEEDVNEKLKELYENCVLLYAATAQRPDSQKIVLDFFVMHGLTSVRGISIILPYISLKNRVKLLRMHFITILAIYITPGNPKLYPDLLEKYTPMAMEGDPNPWLDIIRRGLEPKLDPHVIKVIRALMKAEMEFGSPKNIFMRAAALTLDGYAAYDWNYMGNGWEDAWKD